MKSSLDPILITGSSGFIGKHLLSGLHKQHRPIGLSRSELGEWQSTTDFRPFLEGVGTLIHCAGIAHRRDVPEKEYYRFHVDVTRKLFMDAVSYGVRKILLISTAAVYGVSSRDRTFSEYDLPDPPGPYGASKLQAERVLMEMASADTSVIAIRPPMVYGPRSPGTLASFARGLQKGVPLPVKGLTAHRSVVGIQTLLEGVAHLLRIPNAGGVYNIADPVVPQVGEILGWFAQGMGREKQLKHVPQSLMKMSLSLPGLNRMRAKLFEPFVLNVDRIKETGFLPTGNTMEMLQAAGKSFRTENVR